MPKQSKLMTPEIAEKIAVELRKKAVNARDLMAIARKSGIQRPYPRLIIEGLEAKGWLIYQEDINNKDSLYGVMDFHGGRMEECCLM